jgi:hypothetical protein
VDILDWLFTKGFTCSPKKLLHHIAETGNLDVLNWAIQKNLVNMTDLYFFYKCASNGHVQVFTWMEKKGLWFPKKFPEIIRTSSNARSMFWLIKKNLPVELRGVWREVEEATEMVNPFRQGRVVEAALSVLEDPGMLEGFIEMMREWEKGW